MPTQGLPKPIAVERLSRRTLYFALAIVLLAGSASIAVFTGADGAASSATWCLRLLPVVVCIGLAALRGGPSSRSAIAELQRDEWRRQCLALATRDALVAVMVAQPLLAILLTQAPVSAPAALMACASATLGTAALLISLLLRDR